MISLDATSSSEVSLRKHLHALPTEIVNDYVGDLRTRQAIRFANALDGSKWAPPILVKCSEAEGATSLVELTSLIEERVLTWSNQERVFRKTNASDTCTYTILTNDADLDEMLDHLEIPGAEKEQLRTQIDKQRLRPQVRAEILNAVRCDDAPVIFSFEPEELASAYEAAATEASCTEASTEMFLEVSGGSELRVQRMEGEDVWPAVLRIVSGPQSDAANAVIEICGRRIVPAQPFDKFGIGKVRREDIEGNKQ